MGYVHTVVYMFLADDESRRVFTTEQEAVILAGIKAAFHAEQEKQLQAPALVAWTEELGLYEFKAAFLAELEVLQRVPVLVEWTEELGLFVDGLNPNGDRDGE